MLKSVITFGLVVLLSMANPCQASLNKNLMPRWQANNPLSTATISHDDWQAFLDKYVFVNEEGINLVDYKHLTKKDTQKLKAYIHRLSTIDIDNYNRNEQLAYWINLYNALVIQTVATYYPVANIQEINISPGLFSIGPWGANLVKVKNIDLTLDDIDNRIIRPIWNDPRTHYALNDATIGAPNIKRYAFSGPRINEQLNQAAFEYVNSLRGVQVIEGKLIISKIYDWYLEDFGGTRKLVIKHLAQFAKDPLSSQLKHINTIDSYIYNWHINSPAVETDISG